MRYLMVDTNEGFCWVAVLEVFTFNGIPREFNVRHRSGPTPKPNQVALALSRAFNIDLNKIEGRNIRATGYPMAGDLTIRFDPEEGVRCAQLYSDDRGRVSGGSAGGAGIMPRNGGLGTYTKL